MKMQGAILKRVQEMMLIEKNQKTFFDFWEVGEVQRAAIFCLGASKKLC